jgi:hypothetical protein
MWIEDFSAGYWVLPEVEVVTYDGDRARMQDDLFFDLLIQTGNDPLVGMAGGRHFELWPARDLPEHVVAVPENDGKGARDGDTLLLSKHLGYDTIFDG